MLRGARDESAQSVTEFALVLPFLCALVLVFVDFGKAMNYWIDLTHTANEAARLAAVNVDVTKAPYSVAGAGSLQDYAKKALETNELRTGSSSVDAATVAVCFPSGTQAGSPVTVQVVTKYKLIPFVGGSFTLKGKATMRLEHAATNYAASGTCT